MSFHPDVTNAHAPLQNTCVLLRLFIITSSPWDRWIIWKWMVMTWNGLLQILLIPHQWQLAALLSWILSWSFPPCISTWKTITQEAAGGSSRPRPRVPRVSPCKAAQLTSAREQNGCPFYIWKANERLSSLDLPRRWCCVLDEAHLCRWLNPRGHYSFRAKSANHISNRTHDVVLVKQFLSQHIRRLMQPHQPTDCSIDWRARRSQRDSLQDWVLDFANTGFITETLQARRLRRQYLLSSCFETRLIELMPLIVQAI